MAHGFISWCGRNCRYRLVIAQKREAPDFECTNETSGDIVGLEVVTTYYNEETAEGVWDLARGRTRSYTSDVLLNPDEMLADFITKQISAKCQNQYDVDYPVFLVVDVRAPLTTEDDIVKTVLPRIPLPAGIPFRSIFLGLDLPNWAWRIYPPQPR